MTEARKLVWILAAALMAAACGDSGGIPGGGAGAGGAGGGGAGGTGGAGTGGGGAGGSATGGAGGAVAPFSLRVAVISDLNGSYGSTSYGAPVHDAVAQIVALQPDIVLSTGDMVAGQQAGLDYQAMWAGFHQAVSDPLEGAGIPLAVTPGNHDASAYGGFENERAIYQAQWLARVPNVQMVDDSLYPFRYSFRVQRALFVSLDATKVGPLGSEQMQWLDAQLLQGASDAVRVVFGHVPLYPTAQTKESEIIGDPALEALLVDRSVDVFISGHHHAYYPGKRDALRLLAMACLGAGPRKLIGSDDTSLRSIAWLELDDDGIAALDALAGAAFDQPVDRATLPETVGSGAMMLWRDDLP